ncbi:MAG: 4Fe-4S binding protein [bacterium]|nr:MAG: 4Fe-4S binding protein [bacterium]
MLVGLTGRSSGRFVPWTALSWALVLAAAAGCVVLGVLDIITPPPPLPERELLAVLPGAASIEKHSEPFFHYRAFDGGGTELGAVIVTDSLPPSVRGYMGEIGSAVGITADGRITLAVPLRHLETPYYMAMIDSSGLWKELAGLDLAVPFPGIDTVSGATVSSRAIIRDVREAASLAARSLFAIEVPPPSVTAKNPWTEFKTITVAVLLLLSLAAGISRERAPFKSAVMILNLAGIGFLVNTPLTLSALSRALTLKYPGPENPLLILIFLYILLSVPLQGRAYCRLVCPFGILQQFAARFSPWQFTLTPGVLSLLPGLRRLVLGLLLFLTVWVGWSGFAEVEPFFGLFSLKLTPLLWATVIFFIIVSLFVRRFWCNAMCPTGTMLSMLSRMARPGSGKDDEAV